MAKTTLDDLARSVQEGFLEQRDYMDKKFETERQLTDQQFVAQRHYMDKRFDQLELRLDAIEKQLNIHHDVLESYGQRITRIEKHLGLNSKV